MTVSHKNRALSRLASQKGATLAEAAIIFGVVAAIAVLLMLVVMPRVDSYSQQQQISEAVGLATGYTVSLGDLSTTSIPDVAATEASLASLASLVASNSVQTCAWLVETNGVKVGPDCTVTSSVYAPVAVQGSTGTNCGGEVLKTAALQKTERFAKTECAARAFYGVTQPFNEVLASSGSQHAVQKAASVQAIILTTGGS